MVAVMGLPSMVNVASVALLACHVPSRGSPNMTSAQVPSSLTFKPTLMPNASNMAMSSAVASSPSDTMPASFHEPMNASFASLSLVVPPPPQPVNAKHSVIAHATNAHTNSFLFMSLTPFLVDAPMATFGPSPKACALVT